MHTVVNTYSSNHRASQKLSLILSDRIILAGRNPSVTMQLGYNRAVQTVKTDTTVVLKCPLKSLVPVIGGLFSGGSHERPRLAVYKTKDNRV